MQKPAAATTVHVALMSAVIYIQCKLCIRTNTKCILHILELSNDQMLKHEICKRPLISQLFTMLDTVINGYILINRSVSFHGDLLGANRSTNLL